MYKLIASDIDGTILPDNEVATERTKKAVKLAKGAGCMVCLSTGRRIASAKIVANTLGIANSPLISHCGAVVSLPANDKIFKATHLDAKLAFKIIDIALECGAFVSVYENVYRGQNIFLAPHAHYEKTIAYNSWYGSFCLPLDEGSLNDFADPIQLSVLGKESPVKLAYEKIRKTFSKQIMCVDYGILSSGNYVVDIFAKEVSKASGIQVIMDRYNIKKEEIIAFGDGVNDLEMLSSSGLPVVMANAPAHIKEGFDRIAPCNNDDGFAQVVEDLFSK